MSEEKQVTGVEVANTALTNYWGMLQGDLTNLITKTKNGSKQRAYNDVKKLVAIHTKRWEKQYSEYSVQS